MENYNTTTIENHLVEQTYYPCESHIIGIEITEPKEPWSSTSQESKLTLKTND